MKLRELSLLGTLTACAAAGAMLFPLPSAGLEPPAAEETEGFEVLTRGPVHEAFAESVSFEPEPGLVISTAPPELIEELPPEQQPEGDNVMWIPGYWAWDEDESDFLWISGIWRNLPPEREWIPGYWNEIDGGQYQWVSGYWADAEVEEVEYIATAPPENIDAGPNIAAPSEDHSWVPGNWAWHQSRYAWRPGYWMMPRDDWNWVPSRYCWTPRGYVYVDGYWDYAVAHRGILFAPVHFRHHVYSSPGYYYTPSIVVSLSVFSDHLFVRPRFGHYYFGDYYDPHYRSSGFYASYAWHQRRHCYDPIYAHNRWHHRHDRGWDRRRVEHFNYFRDHAEARPAHRWAAMRNDRNERFRDNEHGRTRQFASTLSGFAKDPGEGRRLRTIDKERRNQLAARSKDMRKFGQQRRQLESRKVAVTGDAKQGAVVREKLARSPISGKRGKELTAKNSPPERPQARRGKDRLSPAADQGLPDGVTRKGKDMPTGKDSRQADNRTSPQRPGDKEKPSGKPQVVPGTKEKAEQQSRQEKLREAMRRQKQPRGDKSQETPKREVQPQRGKTPETPKREVQPKREKAQETPKRQVQPQRQKAPETPKREVQPKREKAQETPKRQVQPQRQKTQETPKRQVQPQRQKAPETPKRQVQPQRQQPQRQVQPQRQQPQRQVQPQRQQPQRQVQPQRQQPQRQVQPQRQQPSGRESTGRGSEGQGRKNR